MKKLIVRYLSLLPLLGALLSGCASTEIEQYAGESPAFNPLTFFNGDLHAWGIVQDWRGRVTRRFVVEIVGVVKDGEVTLNESFRFSDGEHSTRVWRIQHDAGNVTAYADDVIDKATGKTRGNAMVLKYEMTLAVGDSSYRVRFDDAMWQIDERVLINRAHIRKFGVTVGQVTLFMLKQ